MPSPTEDLFQDCDDGVLHLAPELSSLSLARQFVCDVITPWGGPPPADAALMTSELVGNAIAHAGGEVILRVRRRLGRALVEVHDQSSQEPKQKPPDPRRVGGNGMRIVDTLASAWGVTQITDDGKVVWFEIPLHG